jgi:hypothetical protein
MVTSVIGMILSEEGNAVEFLLDPPVDGSLGVYTVLLDDQVRDAAGNLLDGGWTGAGGSLYFGTFGATAVVVDDVACGLGAGSTGRFHPDGDDGEGEEADTVTVNLESLTTPAWWWATVRDLSTGGRLFKEWVVPESGTDSWVWDGRDASGTIARVGDYQLEFQAIDASGNASPLCSVVVGLAQHGGTHE